MTNTHDLSELLGLYEAAEQGRRGDRVPVDYRRNISIGGPPKSGRTTVLRHILRQITEAGISTYLADVERQFSFTATEAAHAVGPMIVAWYTANDAGAYEMILKTRALMYERIRALRAPANPGERAQPVELVLVVADAHVLPPRLLDVVDQIADGGPAVNVFVVKEMLGELSLDVRYGLKIQA